MKCSDFIGPPKYGRKIVILGDTCNPENAITRGIDCDVLVHEATFLKNRSEAYFKGHSTAGMAGEIASRMRANNLILTHFSAKCQEDDQITALIAEAGQYYMGDIYEAKDFMSVDLEQGERVCE